MRIGAELPRHTLVQFTDLHIEVEGAPARRGFDPLLVLDQALRAVEEAQLAPAALLFTGDLAENGRAEEYRRLRAVVEPAAARIGAPVVWVAGNHDVRSALRAELLGGAGEAPLDHVRWLGGLRVVVLDSTVPGHGHGALSADQLGWLRAELATPAPAGTVLALHHPPLPTAAPLLAVLELQRRHELADVLTGTDVRIVLSGHTHVASAGTIAGIPVWTGGPIATVLGGLAPGAELRALRAPSVSRIDLFAGAVIATSVPVDADVVATVPAAEMELRIADLHAALPAG